MTQRIQRATGLTDFRAQFAGYCAKCRTGYKPGDVITRSVRGYVHGVCPKDIPDRDEIFEQVGDYDAFGPWSRLDADYTQDDAPE